jgi:hypothetical protein
MRPLTGVTVEDKIIQRATAAMLNHIYEEIFLGFSYGFWLECGQHEPSRRALVRDFCPTGDLLLDTR